MSEDYQKGFKDGFKIGLEEGKRNQNLNPVPSYKPWPELNMLKETCPKCGIKISGVMGYVCTSPNCPSFYTASYSGIQIETSLSHGPLESKSWPTLEEEKEKLDKYNQVWFNGQWCHLGN